MMSHPDIPEQTSQYSVPKTMSADEAAYWLEWIRELATPEETRAIDLAITALRGHDALVAACERLWLAVKSYGRIGYEGSELLEAMAEARAALDAGRPTPPTEERNV